MVSPFIVPLSYLILRNTIRRNLFNAHFHLLLRIFIKLLVHDGVLNICLFTIDRLHYGAFILLYHHRLLNAPNRLFHFLLLWKVCLLNINMPLWLIPFPSLLLILMILLYMGDICLNESPLLLLILFSLLLVINFILLNHSALFLSYSLLLSIKLDISRRCGHVAFPIKPRVSLII